MRSWNEIRKAATVFSNRWKGAYDEKSQAQSFLKEFFEVITGVHAGGTRFVASADDAERVAHLFDLYAATVKVV